MFLFIAIAGIGLGTGGILLLLAWVCALSSFVRCIAKRSLRGGDWELPGLLAGAALISASIGALAVILVRAFFVR